MCIKHVCDDALKQDTAGNWERYVQNHDHHRQLYVDFTDWLQHVKESLDRISETPVDTTEGIERQMAEIQVET